MKHLLSIGFFGVAVAAFAQEQCQQMQFSGEVAENSKYIQPLLPGLALRVNPIRLEEDPRWAWFEISVAPNNADGVFVFALGDRNWLLDVSDFWSAFIGGANSDLRSALQYRSRYLVFPLRANEKQRARQVARMIVDANGPKQLERALAAFSTLHLGHLQFDITNYGLGSGDISRSVDWVTFEVKITLPPGVQPPPDLPVTYVPCPVVPPELLENMRHPKRHDYTVAATALPNQ